MKTLYHMGMYFDNRYSRKYIDSDDYYAQSESWGILVNIILVIHS